ncbi:MAG: hypothetical protein ACJ8GO_15995 [Ramlibacter sp.]
MLGPLPDADGPEGPEGRLGMLRDDGACCCWVSLLEEAPAREFAALPAAVCACTLATANAATMIPNHLLFMRGLLQ